MKLRFFITPDCIDLQPKIDGYWSSEKCFANLKLCCYLKDISCLSLVCKFSKEYLHMHMTVNLKAVWSQVLKWRAMY